MMGPMPTPHRYIELPNDAPRVEALWETSIDAPGSYVVLPDGRMDLVVRFDGDAQGGASNIALAVIGPSSRPVSIAVERGQVYLGIRFSPGFGACLGVAPVTLVDRSLHGSSAIDALGEHASTLLDASDAAGLRTAMRDVADALAARAIIATPTALAAIDIVHASGGRTPVASIAHMLAVPERILRRHMHDAIGLTPKTFAAVLRFQRTMRLLASTDAKGLAQVAAEGGYSDQAHLTREFRRHGGFTPGQRPPVTLVTLPLGGLADSFNRHG